MPMERAGYEPYAWWLTREQIGRCFRRDYVVAQELPPRLLTLVASFDHRRRPETLRTAMAMAFFCPTNTTSRFPLVTPV